ncbi:MAG: SGNH/GDSL hydrolase family protein [Lachnospiraceae bacterium]|nr:SGNH/GDSL hydrolase family protein [Lachnospiraceae bacterium]
MRENDLRFKRGLDKAKAGKDFTIAFLGGSITQGSLSSTEQTCYAYLVYQWMKSRFPKARMHYVNAGIGGTSSYFGVARMEEDIMIYRPDLVIIDFSVNDEPNLFFQETYEGVIRKLVYADFAPAVLALNNVFYDTGVTAEPYHTRITDAYGIGHVNVKESIYQRIRSGELQREEISPDGLHPNDKGHAMLSEQITEYLDRWIAAVKQPLYIEKPHIPAVTCNRFEHTRRYTIANATSLKAGATFQLDGFTVDTREKQGHLDLWKNGWIGRSFGDKITFTFEGKTLGIQYRKGIHKPAPVAKCIVDGDYDRPILLDGNFQEDWGDCLYLEPVFVEDVARQHTITIDIIKAEHTVEDFYLNALLIS